MINKHKGKKTASERKGIYIMEVIGEFIIELFVEIIGGLFIGLSKSRYVPKWLSIIAITVMTGLFGGILLLIAFAVFGSENLLIVLEFVKA